MYTPATNPSSRLLSAGSIGKGQNVGLWLLVTSFLPRLLLSRGRIRSRDALTARRSCSPPPHNARAKTVTRNWHERKCLGPILLLCSYEVRLLVSVSQSERHVVASKCDLLLTILFHL